ncbi:uncharacterized protein LOC117211981 isoform X1 [Bombus bifarius]|uniref:Uncharacterized protein LOC117211981 isoform X1 n=1 Tax=Bombus bifarius TaxID=103933 RepID=A0A6P8MV06_9HYME|nr:uncharacterized protein LOC117166041 isoform X1 [Bombus vancouverensis nearcticus]XP_033312273.1 uncharacterized protein LOC117211981 isoform X1 [Bombus bifarius]
MLTSGTNSHIPIIKIEEWMNKGNIGMKSMTKKCIICKTEATPISKDRRSFHMFPKNELIRKKWMDAINLLTAPNFKTTFICSDHFDDKSFHDSDELRSRKRLRPDAVPQRISFKKSDDTSKEKDLGSEKLFERPIDKDYSKSEMVTDLSNTCIKATNEQDCLTGEKSNNTMNNVPNSGNRRKHSFIKKIPPKKIRFMNGFKTEYITREDFVSDEAWERFLRLITYERNRMAAAHNRNSRKEKKIRNFKLFIKGLENSEELDATQYVKVCLE